MDCFEDQTSGKDSDAYSPLEEREHAQTQKASQLVLTILRVRSASIKTLLLSASGCGCALQRSNKRMNGVLVTTYEVEQLTAMLRQF